MKKITFVLLLSLICFLLVWIVAVTKCEILTVIHMQEFEEAHRENTMLEDVKHGKVLTYSNEHASVYYVTGDNSSASVLRFVKVDNQWKYDGWQTIWSVGGSASEVIWPYWWHFIYGGF